MSDIEAISLKELKDLYLSLNRFSWTPANVYKNGPEVQAFVQIHQSMNVELLVCRRDVGSIPDTNLLEEGSC